MMVSRPPSKCRGHRKTERQTQEGMERSVCVLGGGDCNRTGWMESE